MQTTRMGDSVVVDKGFTDIRILKGGYSSMIEALKPGKVLHIIQQGG